MVMSFIVKEYIHYSSLKFLINNVKRIARNSIIPLRAHYGFVCDNLGLFVKVWDLFVITRTTVLNHC